MHLEPVFSLAASQHGVVSRAQLAELNIDRHVVQRWVEAGRLLATSTRVLACAGSIDSPMRQLWSAVLHSNAVASHQSSVAVWTGSGFDRVPIEVTRLRGQRRDRFEIGTVHEPRALAAHHVTAFHGVPVTTPARTLFDVAGVSPPARTERILDNFWARRLVTYRELQLMLDELSCRGRSGIVVMRELLEARSCHHRPLESGLEARFQLICARAGITGLVRQVDVGGEDRWAGRADFRHDTLPLVVFVDSDRFHSSYLDGQRDAVQTRQLHSAGFIVVRVLEPELFGRHEQLLGRLHSAFHSARQAAQKAVLAAHPELG